MVLQESTGVPYSMIVGDHVYVYVHTPKFSELNISGNFHRMYVEKALLAYHLQVRNLQVYHL